MTLADRYWMLHYRWHKWRMKRCAKGLLIHSIIMQEHLGVELSKVPIDVNIGLGLPSPEDKD